MKIKFIIESLLGALVITASSIEKSFKKIWFAFNHCCLLFHH